MSEDAGLKLLAAIEALAAEVRGMREDLANERNATVTLQRIREAQRARTAKSRAKTRNGNGTCNVTVTPTPEVVKDLDHKQRDQKQETTSRRHVTETLRPAGQAWEAYSAAYRKRHGADPVRNATTNAQMLAFVKRVGAEEAPSIAEFYVSHRQSFYVQQMHPVGLLLRDAEKLRTEWVTGKRTTSTAARSVDATQANVDGWMDTAERLIAEKKHGVV